MTLRADLEAVCHGRALLGRTIEVHDELASTNDRARELGEAGAPEGALVVAERQTRGRGRHGRTWSSPPGGLYLSLVLRPDDALLRRVPLTLAAALAASEALDAAARVATALKWPNDVLLGDRKVGGVLADLSKDKLGNLLVLGVGLNLSTKAGDFPPELASIATSVAASGKGQVPTPQDVLRLFLDHLEGSLETLRRGGGPVLLSRAADRMPLLRGRVRVKLEGRTLEGKANGLNAQGALVVETDQGTREVVYAGDVEEVRVS